jgi:hypothetical protein
MGDELVAGGWWIASSSLFYSHCIVESFHFETLSITDAPLSNMDITYEE